MALEVLQWRTRAGVLEYLVVLPDGTSMFVPAEWTNCRAKEDGTLEERNRSPSKRASGTIGLVSDFVRIRKIVDGLLNRQVCLDHEPDTSIRRADCHAAETEVSEFDRDTASGATRATLGRARKDDTRTHNDDGKSNRTNNSSRK
jgi:hypothetical protein